MTTLKSTLKIFAFFVFVFAFASMAKVNTKVIRQLSSAPIAFPVLILEPISTPQGTPKSKRSGLPARPRSKKIPVGA